MCGIPYHQLAYALLNQATYTEREGGGRGGIKGQCVCEGGDRERVCVREGGEGIYASYMVPDGSALSKSPTDTT